MKTAPTSTTSTDANQSEDQKWVDAINQITRLTRSGTIEWTPIEINKVNVSSRKVLSAYTGSYEGRKLLMRETTSLPHPMLSQMHSSVGEALGLLPSEDRTFSLLIVDENLSSLFLFPQVNNLIELVAQIKYQLADIDDFLNSLRVSGVAGPMRSADS